MFAARISLMLMPKMKISICPYYRSRNNVKTSKIVEYILSFSTCSILDNKLKLTKVQIRPETAVKLIDVRIFSNPSFGYSNVKTDFSKTK